MTKKNPKPNNRKNTQQNRLSEVFEACLVRARYDASAANLSYLSVAYRCALLDMIIMTYQIRYLLNLTCGASVFPSLKWNKELLDETRRDLTWNCAVSLLRKPARA